MNDLSKAERLKRDSHFLRGTIAEGLADPATGAISDTDTGLLKFHGSYQQDDRDVRDERRRQKLEPDYGFMVRARLPGGVLTPGQWLAFDRIATTWGGGSLRITTRQTFQLHRVAKRDLKKVIAGIAELEASTIAACGDVNRNVVASVNPLLSSAHAEVHQWARTLSDTFKPRTGAYRETWLDEAPVAPDASEEPFYGDTYLPRKFKIGIAIPPVNDIDVFAQDLGLVAIIENGELTGFDLAVGGGMGAAQGPKPTYPQLADIIGFVTPSQLIEAAHHVIAIQRDYGDREDRAHARLKYTIDDRGLDWFKQALESRLGFPLAPARAYRFDHNGDRYGWVEGDDGRWHLTLAIEAGRLVDRDDRPWLTGLRGIARVHNGEFRLTCDQNVIIAGVAANARAAIDALVEAHRLDDYRHASGIRKHALACVALPTCGLAMAESERYLPALLAKVETLLDRRGLLNEPIHLRLSGCPNGCSRPYLGEIALTGRAVGRYDLRLGADFAGERMNACHLENVDEITILDTLDELFADYASTRREGEHFGDFIVRAGIVKPPARRTSQEDGA
ncbi:MAG TPA: NADPH-dependent assimilatory sulfite reductase hemoprotein subunit [Gammaproteobacteria bacterium]|nr:NADPH-dependent assimilatory sulfite reductase hemoprotein subunit [Gammaproteobacteria bacterium]